jgi:3-oxoacyl-[acyl-carrier protein] reductase
MGLTGKTLFITGGNRGIGKEIIACFARERVNIIACTRKENSDFSSYMEILSSEYDICTELLYFDMLDEEAIKGAIKPLIIKKTKIDILVNNAGVATGALLHMMPISELKDVFQINFFSHILITQLISKTMMRERKGSIINMGSVAGLENFAGYTAYGASKAAIMQFTRTAATELAPYNIRVNAIAPGLTDTNMAGQMEEKAFEEMIGHTNMRRLANPSEIAELALFLASDKSSFITGQVIRIDGGM